MVKMSKETVNASLFSSASTRAKLGYHIWLLPQIFFVDVIMCIFHVAVIINDRMYSHGFLQIIVDYAISFSVLSVQ